MNTDWIAQECPLPNEESRNAAVIRQGTLTKPAGSLGRLESIATDFAAWQQNEQPQLNDICIRVFAADHGVCQQGISAFPQEVTAQMVQNFIAGGAAISVLANSLKADFRVINMGTVAPITLPDGYANYTSVQIASSSADFSKAPAMTTVQLQQALDAGRNEVSNCDLFVGGEMGIGNTTSASAIYAALLGMPAEKVVGPGTGIDTTTQTHKAKVIESALALHKETLDAPIDILKHLGGFEIAALTGAYISAAQRRIPILVDGFICSAAALLANAINPSSRAWMVFAHKSAEPAHISALKALEATALLDLDMRLGEGSGAAMAVPIIQNALKLHSNMATFADAGVSNADV